MANIPCRNFLHFIQKRFLSASATVSTSPLSPSSASPSSFTVQYLINSCGLPLEVALSTSQKLRLDESDTRKPESVLKLFKSHGFDDTHIAKLIAKKPSILQCRLDEKLKPKLDFLVENGITGNFLHELIVRNTVLLSRSLDCHIKPSFKFLKDFFVNSDSVLAAIKRSTWLLTIDVERVIQPNINFMVNEGVPIHILRKFVMMQPRTLMVRFDRLITTFENVKKLGLEPTAPMFLNSFRVMISMSETTQNKKVEVLKSLGWSDQDIWSTFKRNPFCLAASEKKLRNMMDFYLNTMKLELATIVSYPRFLMFALDTRLRPRYNVLMILVSKNLIKEDKNKMAWLMTLNEAIFHKHYILKNLDKVPDLLEIYHATSRAKKTSQEMDKVIF
ncbi:Transcription termination factor like [Quillaja saponaria]|uniref:Transcription termination factor like n=1 Tax=Quillaja saponaria TaxID=32244 RepID=A0AAD7QJI2_QUISA|nr:Transcription termination factor like [Quillaja saponaria]